MKLLITIALLLSWLNLNLPGVVERCNVYVRPTVMDPWVVMASLAGTSTNYLFEPTLATTGFYTVTFGTKSGEVWCVE